MEQPVANAVCLVVKQERKHEFLYFSSCRIRAACGHWSHNLCRIPGRLCTVTLCLPFVKISHRKSLQQLSSLLHSNPAKSKVQNAVQLINTTNTEVWNLVGPQVHSTLIWDTAGSIKLCENQMYSLQFIQNSWDSIPTRQCWRWTTFLSWASGHWHKSPQTKFLPRVSILR